MNKSFKKQILLTSSPLGNHSWGMEGLERPGNSLTAQDIFSLKYLVPTFDHLSVVRWIEFILLIIIAFGSPYFFFYD